MCGCGCGRPQDRPGQSYRRDCHAEYQRGWRAEQAAARANLGVALRLLVVTSGELRQLCDCPPGKGCPECRGRRVLAARLELVAMLIAPLVPR